MDQEWIQWAPCRLGPDGVSMVPVAMQAFPKRGRAVVSHKSAVGHQCGSHPAPARWPRRSPSARPLVAMVSIAAAAALNRTEFAVRSRGWLVSGTLAKPNCSRAA